MRFDPEDLREIVGAYRHCVADTVSRFEGFVAKYMDDAVPDFGISSCQEIHGTAAVRASRRARWVLLSVRKAVDDIKKILILRKLPLRDAARGGASGTAPAATLDPRFRVAKAGVMS